MDRVSGGRAPHVLWIPGLAHAHVISSFRLMLDVAKRGVAVTCVVRRKLAPILQEQYSPQEFAQIGMSFELIDGELTERNPILATPEVAKLLEPLKEKWLVERKSGLFRPTCMLVDRYFAWAKDLAAELEIPRFVFVSNGVLVVRFYQAVAPAVNIERETWGGRHKWDILERELRKHQDLNFFQERDVFQNFHPGNGFFDRLPDLVESILSAEGLVFNSYRGLESALIEGLLETFRRQNAHKQEPRIYSVGPLADIGSFRNEKCFDSTVEDCSKEHLGWLDSQPPGSVIYVCMGSVFTISGPQFKELAAALDSSEQRFFWALPRVAGDFTTLEKALPSGFLERVGSRGKVFHGWSPQLAVLAHEAVGGFLSHCGWQSVLESLTCGVPILGWPLASDQSMNCRYVTDVLKAGLRVTEKVATELTCEDELREGIVQLMASEGGRAVSEAAKRWKSELASAVAPGGCSSKARDDLMKALQSDLGPR